MSDSVRTIIGCMTGTSVDGLDVSVVRVLGRGREMSATPLENTSSPLGALEGPMRSLCLGAPMAVGTIADLARRLGELHALVAAPLAARHGPIDFVAVHGQTVHHAPPNSWQMIDPWPLAKALRVPVVCDFRRADLAAGGEGAPITPLADWVLFRDGRESRAIVNLGGFCNITRLPAGAEESGVEGGDVCSCNHVLDAAARHCIAQPFDEGGSVALGGRASHRAATALVEILAGQAKAGRSLGSGDECTEWIDKWAGSLRAPDVLASAAEAVGRVIADAAAGADRVVCAGGGARNRALMGAIERACGKPVATTDELGVPITHREAVAMAVLGALCQDGIAITLPAITGVRSPAPLAGLWTSGWTGPAHAPGKP
jgi:1,6-anhydro-N-acetylmuramate kinase